MSDNEAYERRVAAVDADIRAELYALRDALRARCEALEAATKSVDLINRRYEDQIGRATDTTRAIREVVTAALDTAPRGKEGRTMLAETGMMQFGDDWRGVFIRGDNAAHFAAALDYAISSLRDGDIISVVLQGLRDTLSGSFEADSVSDVQQLRPFDECVVAAATSSKEGAR